MSRSFDSQTVTLSREPGQCLNFCANNARVGNYVLPFVAGYHDGHFTVKLDHQKITCRIQAVRHDDSVVVTCRLPEGVYICKKPETKQQRAAQKARSHATRRASKQWRERSRWSPPVHPDWREQPVFEPLAA